MTLSQCTHAKKMKINVLFSPLLTLAAEAKGFSVPAFTKTKAASSCKAFYLD